MDETRNLALVVLNNTNGPIFHSLDAVKVSNNMGRLLLLVPKNKNKMVDFIILNTPCQ